jgi:hypothetical protein
MARENGLDEMVITACLLHDIAVIALLSANHGYRRRGGTEAPLVHDVTAGDHQ